MLVFRVIIILEALGSPIAFKAPFFLSLWASQVSCMSCKNSILVNVEGHLITGLILISSFAAGYLIMFQLFGPTIELARSASTCQADRECISTASCPHRTGIPQFEGGLWVHWEFQQDQTVLIVCSDLGKTGFLQTPIHISRSGCHLLL